MHGRGKGHAIRARSVLAKLRSQHRVRVFCAGASWRLLGDLPETEPVAGCVPGAAMIPSFLLRLRTDLGELLRWSPDLVLSDGDGPSVHAAKALDIPTVSMGHGLIFKHADLEVSLPARKRWREVLNAMSSSWPSDRRIAVHFAPAVPRTRGTVIARPDVPRLGRSNEKREDFILAYFRDDNGALALEQLLRRGHRIVCFGDPSRMPVGVEAYAPDICGFSEALGRCSAVVGSAGSTLLAECALLELPMLALYRYGDAEQEMNAGLVRAAGIGIGAPIQQVGPGLIRRFEEELERPRTDLARRTRAMPPVSVAVPRVVAELCPPTSVSRSLAWVRR